MKDLGDIAKILDDAARTAKTVPQFVGDDALSLDNAYAVQALSMARRYARGDLRVGFKMGLTSRAKMIQVGVDEVIWGRLTANMRVEEGGEISMQDYVHPRAEPEIAFLISKPLSGKVSALEAMAAVEAVAPALEIIDSRYENFQFSLGDVVADNSSSSGFIMGHWNDPKHDLSNLGMLLEVNGRVVQSGSSAALLGHPVRSLVAAARMVAKWGETLMPGDIILAGAATAAHPLQAGMTIRNSVQGLGACSFNVKE